MLQKQTVSISLLKALKRLMNENILKDFRLVGGTALSLQLSHRISIDIDLFTDDESIDMNKIASALKRNSAYDFPMRENRGGHLVNGLAFFVEQVKVDLYKWQRKFTDSVITVDGIRMASLNDIAILKLDAIHNRIHKKDFIDLYFLFAELGGENIINNYLKHSKQATMQQTLENLKRAQGSFNNKTPMPEMLKALGDTDEVVNKINLVIDKISQKIAPAK